MFQVKTTHACTVAFDTSKSLLPPLPPNASTCRKLLRSLKKIILVAERNPQSLEFFRSATEIITERKKQVKSGSWIIHPFSTFRLYYEMWMTLVLFSCLIYMPLNAAFKTVFHLEGIVDVSLDILCITDIIVTFRTGYCSLRTEEVVMKPCAIAIHYIFSIYFICDVLSAIPEVIIKNEDMRDIANILGLLKIVRMGTFITYLSRTLYYLRLQSMITQVIKLLSVIILLSHYYTCLVYMLPTLDDKQFSEDKDENKSFLSNYIFNLYQGTGYLLGIALNLPPKIAWKSYIIIGVAYCGGKILLTFATVVIVDLLKSKNSLENKYYMMMSQVDAYMVTNKVPSVIQKRMREYYQYKYRQKYFKESSITKFISENLKKEINYHVCRKLVEGVKIFEKLSQRILEDILTHLKVEIYLTGDVIIQAGTEGDSMYFLSSGTVKVSSPSGKEICHLEDGAYFGEIALVTSGQKRSANIVAIEVCELYKLDKKSFKKCMEGNKDLYKKIQHEAKKRLAATQQVESRFMKEFAQKL